MRFYLDYKQGGRKVISDGGSLVIRKMVFFQRISHFKFFHYIKFKKMGAPRDTRGPQFRPPWVFAISREIAFDFFREIVVDVEDVAAVAFVIFGQFFGSMTWPYLCYIHKDLTFQGQKLIRHW